MWLKGLCSKKKQPGTQKLKAFGMGMRKRDGESQVCLKSVPSQSPHSLVLAIYAARWRSALWNCLCTALGRVTLKRSNISKIGGSPPLLSPCWPKRGRVTEMIWAVFLLSRRSWGAILRLFFLNGAWGSLYSQQILWEQKQCQQNLFFFPWKGGGVFTNKGFCTEFKSSKRLSFVWIRRLTV